VEADEWRGDHGICNGDSGGPAIDGEGFVIGVTSRGPAGCDDPVYGDLTGHAPWLRDAARRAAQGGSYEVPSWASSDAEQTLGAPFGPERSAAGCTTATGTGGGGGASSLLAALAWVAARRRRGWRR
jgi:hypothetical protein